MAWRGNTYYRTILNINSWYFNKDFLGKDAKEIPGIIFSFCASYAILTDRLYWYKKDTTVRSEFFWYGLSQKISSRNHLVLYENNIKLEDWVESKVDGANQTAQTYDVQR